MSEQHAIFLPGYLSKVLCLGHSWGWWRWWWGSHVNKSPHQQSISSYFCYHLNPNATNFKKKQSVRTVRLPHSLPRYSLRILAVWPPGRWAWPSVKLQHPTVLKHPEQIFGPLRSLVLKGGPSVCLPVCLLVDVSRCSLIMWWLCIHMTIVLLNDSITVMSVVGPSYWSSLILVYFSPAMIISITQPIIETFSNIMTSVLLVHIMSFYPPFFGGANFFMDFKVKHPCHYMPIPCSTIRSKKSLGWTWTCPWLTSTWMRTPTSSAKRSNKMAVRLTPED